MKTEKNILIAFILNLSFAIFEFFGGIFTGSIAILSDAVHDLVDAASIGISYFLEKKSKLPPDEQYTYGYARYSVLGGMITTLLLLLGSAAVIYNALRRITTPAQIHYSGMILFAVVGVCVNLFATVFTRDGDSVNQKAVNLHMLEDVLGWAVVLVGAIVMAFTDFTFLDPILSIGVAVYILIHALKNLKQILHLFLEKTPEDISIDTIRKQLTELSDIADVHHIHIWSMDGRNNYATMHIVTNGDSEEIKYRIREELRKHGITHVTLQLERVGEHCHERNCTEMSTSHSVHHHHHHHHHHHY